MHPSTTTKFKRQKSFHFPEVFSVYIDHSFIFCRSLALESCLNVKLLDEISAFEKMLI